MSAWQKLGKAPDKLEGVTVLEEQSLGKGFFGKVCKGVWNLQLVAVKSIGDMKEADLTTVWKEVEILRVLKSKDPSPHILKFFGYFMRGTALWIVTEYASHRDLRSFLQSEGKTYDIRYRAVMALHILKGLFHLEKNGIIHRDIACRNVLMNEEDGYLVLKIGDFGLSRTSTYKGNPDSHTPTMWSAPEVVSERKFSHKSDVWSFGATFIELLNGKDPVSVKNRDMGDYLQEVWARVEKAIVHKTTLVPAELYPTPEIVKGVKESVYKNTMELLKKVFKQEPSDRTTFGKLLLYVDPIYMNAVCPTPSYQVTRIPAPSRKPATQPELPVDLGYNPDNNHHS